MLQRWWYRESNTIHIYLFRRIYWTYIFRCRWTSDCVSDVSLSVESFRSPVTPNGNIGATVANAATANGNVGPATVWFAVNCLLALTMVVADDGTAAVAAATAATAVADNEDMYVGFVILLWSCGREDKLNDSQHSEQFCMVMKGVCERERVAGREKARRRPESHLSHHTASNMQMANKAYSLSHSDRQCLSYVYYRCSPHPSKLKANGYEMYLVRRFSGWCGKCRRLTGRYDQFIFVYRCSTCFSIRRWWCPFDRCTSTGFICHRCCGRWRWGGGRRSFIRLMLAQQIGRFFFLRFRLQVTFLCTNFAVQLAGFARLTFPLCIRDAVCTCTCVC